jgi:hypothetical protein
MPRIVDHASPSQQTKAYAWSVIRGGQVTGIRYKAEIHQVTGRAVEGARQSLLRVRLRLGGGVALGLKRS